MGWTGSDGVVWGVRERKRERRERQRPRRDCPTAVWLACVVVFGAKKPRRSPHEFIIRLFQLRHSQ